MLKYRAISFPLLLALLGAMIFWEKGGPWLFLFLAPLTIGLVVYEIGAMLRRIEIKSFVVPAAVFGAIMSFFFLGQAHGLHIRDFYWYCLAGIFFFGGWAGLLFAGDKRDFFDKLLHSLGIVLLGAFPLLFLAMIYFDGGTLLLYLMLVTKMMDTGGYIAGMLSGKLLKNGNHKIFPAISPKKSWEGTIGGIVFSVATALIFYRYFPVGQMPLQWYIVSGVILAVGSLAGDLTESALKRTCGIKDSGNYIPGMGGAFDVMDSFIYNGAIFLLLLQCR